MISRAILCVAISVVGLSNMFPATIEPPKLLTPAQLQSKAKQKSISNVCKGKGKRKSKTVKDMCRRWDEQQNA
jgi:hypothetical protein